MTNKKELLSQLKIDRTEEDKSSGISMPIVIILVLIAMGTGIAGGVYFLGADNSSAANGNAHKSNAGNKINNNEPNKIASEAKTAASKPSSNVDKPIVKKKADANGRAILDASGYITARRMATVSAQLTGLITDVLVEEGMKVEKGQVLAQLDNALVQVSLDLAKARAISAEARVRSARASYAEAQRVLKRVSKLKSNDFSSEARLTNSILGVETSRAELARAEADMKVAKLEIKSQQERFDDHTIRAPFAGVVTIKNAQPGEIVSPVSAGGGFTRTGICTIVDMASLEIEADVNEAFIGRIYSGQKVTANLDAYPDWDIPAHVIAIIPTANRNKATVRVRIKLDSDDPRILPDMGVKMSFF